MSNLQPKQFWYHSSNANLTPGVDQIKPANDMSHHGRANYDYHGGFAAEADGSNRGDWTFAADTEEEAEWWKPIARTPYGARSTTYVVRPAEGVDTDTETHHYMSRPRNAEDRGTHLKAKGPMDIVDRIDIPRPTFEGMTVQGTLPPVNWGRYREPMDPDVETAVVRTKTAQGIYDDDNAMSVWHPQVRKHREQQEALGGGNSFARADYETDWKKAGQMELDL